LVNIEQSALAAVVARRGQVYFPVEANARSSEGDPSMTSKYDPDFTRRELLAVLGLQGAALALSGGPGAVCALGQTRPKGMLIDTHIHLFADDQKRFPYHANATYKPPAEPLEAYVTFVRQAKIDHAIIVHPEPYQDDHRYLEYCFAHEPSEGFFKGTCLYDAIAPQNSGTHGSLGQEAPWPDRGPTHSQHQEPENGAHTIRTDPRS
jgi:hypothetical protein